MALYEDDASGGFFAGLFALTLNHFNVDKMINPFVDIGVQTPEGADAGNAVILDAGLGWLIGRNLQIDGSAGKGTTGSTPPQYFFQSA